MTTAQVVHASDLGAGLEVAGGKVVPSASMTTDVEMDAASAAARDAAIAAAATDAQAKADASQAAATSAAQAMVDASNSAGAATDAAQDAAAATESTGDNVVRMAQAAFTHNWTVDVRADGGIRFRGNGRGYPRGIIMGAGRGSHASLHGFWDVHVPTEGTVIKGLGTADVVADSEGFFSAVTADWAHLYLRMPPAGSPNGTPVEWVRATYREGNYEITDDLILIGTMNLDEGGGPFFQLADGTKCFTGTTYPDSPWIALPLAANVVNYGGEYQTCQYRRLNNRVYVRGLCDATATGFGGTGHVLLAVLPVGFRPPARLIKSVSHNEGQSRVDILADGGIVHMVGTTAHTWVPLEFDFDLLG